MNALYVLLLAQMAFWNPPTFISPDSRILRILVRIAPQEMVMAWQMSSSMSYWGFSEAALRFLVDGSVF